MISDVSDNLTFRGGEKPGENSGIRGTVLDAVRQLTVKFPSVTAPSVYALTGIEVSLVERVFTSYEAEGVLVRDPQNEGHWRLTR